MLNNNQLKLIAILAMLIDHIGAVLINMEEHHALYFTCRLVGRIAFPVFCFLIVEGFLHTKNIKKYFGRLFIFTLISEIPYDLAFCNKVIDLHRNNVFITLLLGLSSLYLIKFSEEKFKKKERRILYIISVIVVTGVIGSIANWLKCDYGFSGILLIVVFYLTRNKRSMQLLFGSTSWLVTEGYATYSFYQLPGIIQNGFGQLIVNISYLNRIYNITHPNWNLSLLQSTVYMWISTLSILGILVTGLYNGKKGKSNLKWFFYLFYPVHLLVLYIVSVAF